MLKNTLLHRLQTASERHEELRALLSDNAIISNQEKFRAFSKEYSDTTELVSQYQVYCQLQEAAEQAEKMQAEETDLELKKMAEEESFALKGQLENQALLLQQLLLPKDPDDSRNIFVEIRAGAGGNEASIFAGDLFRMYSRYASTQGWQVEIVSEHASEQGGFKEIIARIAGQNVYSKLKFESGVHRVQRVPVTEAQGRIHTSTCTVAIMPEIDEVDSININPADLKIDTYRSSGAGGQHVNKTDSAIRITHLPSGVVVECQDERSQHKNRAKAMALLQSRLLSAEREKQNKSQAETRRNLVGTGDRSERIRTYNYPQNRVTDHRINVTLYKLDLFMQGDIQSMIEALLREYQADQLAELDQQ